MDPIYHVIEGWRTAASAYPRASLGPWQITARTQAPGLYPLQTLGSFYYLPQPIEVTVLKEGERVWFTDEPRQVYALAEIGLFRAHGRVVVGGLGLGLIHHFLSLNPGVTSIVTIERGPELQELVWPHVRKIQPSQLIIGDFYDVLPHCSADTVITDFIFGHQDEATWKQLQEQRAFCQRHLPQALFLEHGYQRRLDAEVVEAAVPPLPPGVPAGAMFDQVLIIR